MKIKCLKLTSLTLLLVLFVTPMAYAYLMWDYDRDEGETGSWCDAYVAVIGMERCYST